MLAKVTTSVTYKVPLGAHCNLLQPGSLTKPSSETCRFCVKDGKYRYCAIYNEPLVSEGGLLMYKTESCKKAMMARTSTVEEPEPIKPAELIKYSIDEYLRVYNNLVKQGYPAKLAEQAAYKAIVK